MSGHCTLKPTHNQTFEVEGRGGCDFAAVLADSYRLQEQGRFAEACDMRFQAFQRLAAAIPEDGETVLEWGHRNTQAALELLRASAVDHFLAGDTEMTEAMLEMLLDLDPEDHTESVPLLGLCYVASGEYDLFEEVSMDIADSLPEKHVAMLWASWQRTGALDEGVLRVFRERFGECFEEFCRDDHPADGEYMAGMASERPSRSVLARDLWLRTEHLWLQHPDFIAALHNFRQKICG